MPDLFKSLETSNVSDKQSLPTALTQLKYNSAGLVPAIAQDKATGEVLMLAWMNQEAIEETLRSGRVTYYSRSRQQLWCKGDTSGHTQHLETMRIDCDGDALLLSVIQRGPACHTNRNSCFYLHVEAEQQQIVVLSTQE